MKKGFIKFQDYLAEELKDPGFKKAFDEEEVFAQLAIQIAQLREKQGLSQKELAKKLHTTQQMVSRLENPHNQSLSLGTLVRLARVFQKKIQVQFLN